MVLYLSTFFKSSKNIMAEACSKWSLKKISAQYILGIFISFLYFEIIEMIKKSISFRRKKWSNGSRV